MECSSHMLDGLKAVLRPKNLPVSALSLSEEITLKCARIHEVEGISADGFSASVIGAAGHSAIWIGRRDDVCSLSPLALARYFDPSRLTLVECLTRKELLWAAEQALRSGGFQTVILQLRDGPNLEESRRLQLCAETGEAIGIAMIEKRAQSSAAQTRWMCEPIAQNNPDHFSPLWQWTLTKNKDGQLGSWMVRRKEADHATGHVDLVSTAVA